MNIFFGLESTSNIEEVGVSSIFNSTSASKVEPRDIQLYFALDWYASLLALEDKIYSNIAQY